MYSGTRQTRTFMSGQGDEASVIRAQVSFKSLFRSITNTVQQKPGSRFHIVS